MLVTIYLPTRNRRVQLQQAVESVLAQTHRQLELIVVDDASSDATPDYLAGLARADSRVKVLRQAHPTGAPAARNRAIALARGSFITGIDDDDQFEPLRIELFLAHWDLLERIGERPAFLYAQDLNIIDGRVAARSAKRGSVHYELMFVRNEVGNQIFAPAHHWREVGMFDERLPAWQDLELEMKLLRRYGTARLLDVATYRFDMTPRADRISKQGLDRLKHAYTIVSTEHAADNPRREQQLYAQMFSRFYGFKPGWRDWAYCIKRGMALAVLGKLLQAAIS